MELFNIVCCGGTFDRLHKGHKSFLKACASSGKKMIIGLTTDKYIKTSKIGDQNFQLIKTYKERKKELMHFLEKEGFLSKIEIVPIDDLFGPTLSSDFNCEALVISEASIENAEIINKERKKRGLPLLKIIVKKIILADDKKPISSYRIREGKINREGEIYFNPFWIKKKKMLTNSLRKILQKPLGKIISDFSKVDANDNIIVTVGDATTIAANSNSIFPHLSVIDFKVNRLSRFTHIKEFGFLGGEEQLFIKNPAGCITPELFKKISDAMDLVRNKKRVILRIEGEEDLAVLPLIIALPLGSLIFYGQPEKGIVKIEVSERDKEKAFNIINQFKG